MMNKMSARVLTYELRRIIKLWQFKAQKVEKVKEDDHLAIFTPSLWQMGIYGCGKEWYHFQHQVMVSKTIVKHFS